MVYENLVNIQVKNTYTFHPYIHVARFCLLQDLN